MNADETILKKGLQNGDKEVFKHLYVTYSPGLTTYGTSITHDFEAARELVQDLFLDLWEKRQQIKIQGALKPYLYSSMYHRGLNWLRSRKIRELYVTNPLEITNWFASSSSFEHRDPLKLEWIEKEIRLLPDQPREVFTRAVLLDEKQQDIAIALGLNIKTIENHLSRARKILRERLKKIR